MKATPEVLLFLLLDLAVIISVARLFAALATRLRQPAVIGEIVAGILLGPTVLGRLAPGLPDSLFPAAVPLKQLADLGLVFFMFLVGLELDPRLIRAEGRRALVISLSGVLAPFLLGALIAVPLLPLNNGGVFVEGASPPPPLAFALFMGAAMCITAFPVLARILVERGLYKTPLGTATLCAAAVDDVIAWTLLATVVGITRTGSAEQAGHTALLTLLFVLGMLTLGRRLLALLAKRHEATGRLSVNQVATVIVGLLLSAYATEWIGIHSIFGAFIFGTVMPRGSRMTRELIDKIEDFTVVVLLPVFFAVAGLRTNLFAIDSLELFMWMLVIIAVAIVGKLAGCGLAARFNGYSTRDALAVGTLMNTRGLTELVILTVGLNLGVLSDRTFAMMVVMAVVTTFMAAPIINRIMPRREMVRVLGGGDPAPIATRILVALGNPLNARALVDAGIHLTGLRHPAELLLVRLIATPRAPEFRTGLRDEESQVDASLEAMNALGRQAASSGVTTRSVSFLSDDVGRDLSLIADTQCCETVLVGWHRASLTHGVVRALVHRLFELVPCHVVVFVDRQGTGVELNSGKHVEVAFTSEHDRAAVVTIAEQIARSLQTAPRLDSTVGSTSGAAAAVVGVGGSYGDEDDFSADVTAFAAAAQCPVLVVRPGRGAAASEAYGTGAPVASALRS